MYWNVLECTGMYWNVPGDILFVMYWMYWNVLECTGMYWDVLECTGGQTVRNVLDLARSLALNECA